MRLLNPGTSLIEVFNGEVGRETFKPCGLYDPGSKLPDVSAWLGEEAARAKAERTPASVGPSAWRRPGAAPAARQPARHDADVQSFVLACDQPLDWHGFGEGLSLLLEVHGERVLRIKGLLNVSGDPLPRIVQCVQHVTYPPASLPAWPESGPYADRRSRLVFIVRELPQGEVENILGSLCGQAPVSSKHRGPPTINACV